MERDKHTQAEETPLAYRAVRGGLWVMASSYWQIGFGFVANIFMTRILFPEAYGTFALAMFFAQLLRLQPRLGLGKAFAQYPETSGRTIGTYIQLEVLATAGTLLLGVLAYRLLPALGYSQEVALLSLVLLGVVTLESLAAIGSTLLDKELRFGPASFVHSVAFPTSYAPAFWLALHGGGAWSLVAQSATYNLIVVGGIWWAVRRRLPHVWHVRWRFDGGIARRFLRFGLIVGVMAFAGSVFGQVDNFLVGTYVGKTGLGYYDRAYRTAQWPALLLNSLLARTAFYTYTRLQDDTVRLRKSFEMIIWLIMIVGTPVALALIIASPDLIALLYTEKWLPSAPYLRILVLFAAMRPLWSNASHLLVGIGKPQMMIKLNLLQIGLLVTLGFPLTIYGGVLGICVAVAVAQTIGLAAVYHVVAREIHFQANRYFAIQIFIVVVVLALYYLIDRTTGLQTLPLASRTFVKMVYAIAMFGLLSFALQPRTTRKRLVYVKNLLLQR